IERSRAPRSNSELTSRPAFAPRSGPQSNSMATFNADPFAPPNGRTAFTSSGRVVNAPLAFRNVSAGSARPSSEAWRISPQTNLEVEKSNVRMPMEEGKEKQIGLGPVIGSAEPNGATAAGPAELVRIPT